MDTTKQTWILMNAYLWAKGKSLFDVVETFKGHGADLSEKLICVAVIGDDNAQPISMLGEYVTVKAFGLERSADSCVIIVGKAEWRHWKKQIAI